MAARKTVGKDPCLRYSLRVSGTLSFSILFCSILYTILFYFNLFYSIYYSVLFYFVLFYILFYSFPFCSILYSFLFYSILLCSILLFSSLLFSSVLGCVIPLQDAALRQSPPTFSVFCYPCLYHSLLPHNVISATKFWSSN